MTLFGLEIQSFYLTVLIITGCITILYIFFGDILDSIGEGIPFFNPAILLAFTIFFSATGYIFEVLTSFSSTLIIAIAAFIAFILSIFLHFFVLVPLSSAEHSLGYTEDSLKGRIGRIIVSIPEDGYGEIVIDSNSGTISRPAASYEKIPIPEGTQVLVIDIAEGVLHVIPYESLDANEAH